MRARYTLEVAQQHLDAWIAADLALATGKSYSIGTRSLTRANLSEIERSIRYWQEQVDLAKGIRKSKVRLFIPMDL